LKLEYDKPVSNFASNFNLRLYGMDSTLKPHQLLLRKPHRERKPDRAELRRERERQAQAQAQAQADLAPPLCSGTRAALTAANLSTLDASCGARVDDDDVGSTWGIESLG